MTFFEIMIHVFIDNRQPPGMIAGTPSSNSNSNGGGQYGKDVLVDEFGDLGSDAFLVASLEFRIEELTKKTSHLFENLLPGDGSGFDGGRGIVAVDRRDRSCVGMAFSFYW